MSSVEPSCFCQSQKPFSSCCEPFLKGLALPQTPEELMRSRYTAFITGDRDYILNSWHPDTRPELSDDEPNTWVGLEIVESSIDGDDGQVEFKAKLIHNDYLEILHEDSDFVRVEGRWFYYSGEFLNENARPKKIGRKEPCPCGSGLPYKFCHGKKA